MTDTNRAEPVEEPSYYVRRLETELANYAGKFFTLHRDFITGIASTIRTLAAEVEASRLPLAGAAVQQPVAWMHVCGSWQEVSERQLDDDERARGWTQFPLYEHPAPSPLPTAPAGARTGAITSIDEMCAILKEHNIESIERTDCAVLYTVTFDQLRAIYDRGRAALAAAPLERIARMLNAFEIQQLRSAWLDGTDTFEEFWAGAVYAQRKFAEVNGITLAQGEAKGDVNG